MGSGELVNGWIKTYTRQRHFSLSDLLQLSLRYHCFQLRSAGVRENTSSTIVRTYKLVGILIATMRDRGIIMSTVARYFAADPFLLIYLVRNVLRDGREINLRITGGSGERLSAVSTPLGP